MSESVFKKYNSFRLTPDEKKQIFTDAVWYALARWDATKSAFQTFLVNNIRYKTLGLLKQRPTYKTNTQLEHFVLNTEDVPLDDFDRIISPLPEKLQRPLVQKYVLNMSMNEIAQTNGNTISEVTSYLTQAIKKLQKIYDSKNSIKVCDESRI